MSDRRLRQLERQAAGGGAADAVHYARALIGVGRKEEARRVLHPLTKRCPEARPPFVALLPTPTSCAFCTQCGNAFELDVEGYPVNKKGTRSEKRSRCSTCAYAHPFGRHGRFDSSPERPVKQGYCGRCGIVLRVLAHRCDRRLPDWITGGDVKPRRTVNRHWSNWRALV